MNESQHRVFEKLISDLSQQEPVVDPAESVTPELGDRTIRALLYAMLRFDASSSQALNAISRIRSSMVDLNELRIAYPDEIAELLGPRYPRVMERSERIRAVLCDVFNREHEITIASLFEMNKREARMYLEGLEGITPFAAHRVGLTVFGIHCMPVDQKLVAALIEAGALDEGTTPSIAAGPLERAIRATDSLDSFLRLESWAENGGGRVVGRQVKKVGEGNPSTAKGR